MLPDCSSSLVSKLSPISLALLALWALPFPDAIFLSLFMSYFCNLAKGNSTKTVNKNPSASDMMSMPRYVMN
jgi:hypothetical protein